MSASLYCARCGALNQPQAARCFACGRSLTEPAPPATDARRLIRGRYRLVRQLGVGGFGAVYQAEDTALGHRLVAVKEMSPRGLKPEEAREATEAFQREALLLAGLAHPSLPRIYERFEEEGRWYLVMDFIEGETLEVYLDKRGGNLPVKEALQMALQLSEVLGYLHSRQPPIIFRDLKPSNIIRTPEGQLALVDFGIARFFKPGQSKDTIAFGSPGYAAPEQYGKAQTTPRSDVFSLGALLHQMLTGIDPSEKPFRFAPLTMPRPAGLSSLIERMVDMDESKRPPSMEVIQRELTRLLDAPSTSWRVDDLALTGASLSPARVAMGAQPVNGPFAQLAGYSGPPVQPWATPQPAAKKAKNSGWVFWLVLMLVCAGVPTVVVGLGFLVPHYSNTVSDTYPNTNGGYSSTPVDQPTDTPTPPVVAVYTLAWSPDGQYIASAGRSPNFQVWNAASGQQLVSVTTNFNVIYALAWSPDGKYIAAVGDTPYDIEIWDASNGAPAGVIKENTFNTDTIAWSPDSTRLALACGDGAVRIVDVSNGNNILTYTGHSQQLNAVAWSPDGKNIASGGIDGTVQVWDSATGQTIYSLGVRPVDVNSLAWSPDGTRIALATTYNNVETWDALTGEHLLIYKGNQLEANTIAWSPDGKYLAAGDDDKQVLVWASDSRNLVYTYTKHTGPVRTLAWAPDGNRIASAGIDGTVQVWYALTGVTVVTYQQPS